VRVRNREERKGNLNEGRTVTAGGGFPWEEGERRRGHSMFALGLRKGRSMREGKESRGGEGDVNY
jgi:hypothetical protein